MANTNSTQVKQSPSHHFEPFSWMRDEVKNHHTDLLETSHDIARGIKKILQMIQASELDEVANETPMLGVNDREALFLLAIATSKLLEEKTNEEMSTINSVALQKAASVSKQSTHPSV